VARVDEATGRPVSRRSVLTGLGAAALTGLALPLLSAADPPVAEATAPPGLDLFLLLGQSNMSGRAPIETGDVPAVPRAWLYTDERSGSWLPATNPLSRFSTVERPGIGRLGPGYTFARAFTARYPRRMLGLVVNARGGSSLRAWAPGRWLFAEAVRRARSAARFGAFRGVLWHQGEANVADLRSADELAAIVVRLRAALGEPALPFVAGEIYAGPHARTGSAAFNARLAALPALVPHTAVVSGRGLRTLDGVHLDSASQRTLGRRFADGWELARTAGAGHLSGGA
jgi:hypothetical protein